MRSENILTCLRTYRKKTLNTCVPPSVKAQCPFFPWFLLLEKNKTKQNCWILQNPPVKDNSPHQHTLTQRWWHLAPHSNLLLPRFVRGFFFLIFHLLRCLTPVPPCFPSKTFLFALYISALSPFCPLFFYMSIFLSFLFHFLPTYPFPILSLSLNFSLTVPKSFSLPLFVINQGFRTAALGQRHQLWGWWDKRCSSLGPVWRFIGLG